MKFREIAKLICLDAVFLAVLIAFTYTQTRLSYFVSGGGLFHIDLPAGYSIYAPLLANLPVLVCPILGLFFCYIVSRFVKYPRKLRLVIVNSVLVCLVVSFLTIVLFNNPASFQFGSLSFSATEMQFYVFPYLVGATLTQIIAAALFLRKRSIQ